MYIRNISNKTITHFILMMFMILSFTDVNAEGSIIEKELFELVKVELLTPTNGVTNFNLLPYFTWSEDSEATSYRFQVATDINFENLVIDSTVGNTNYNSSKLHEEPIFEPIQTYFWRVRSLDGDQSAEWSDISEFSTGLETVDVLYPENGDDLDSNIPKLMWKAIRFAEQYQIQIIREYLKYENENSGSTTRELVLNETISDTSYKLTVPLIDGEKYQLKITGIKGDFESAEDEYIYFDLRVDQIFKPELLNPISSGSVAPEFIWESVDGANEYVLELASGINFTEKIFSVLISDTTFQTSEPLNYSEEYHWRVRAKGDTAISAWERTEFQTEGVNIEEQKVELIYPEDNSEGLEQAITYRWNSIFGASEYTFELSKQSDFQEKILSSVISDSSFSYGNLAEDGSEYFWRVRAHAHSQTSKWSDIYLFIILNNTANEVADIPSYTTLKQNYPNPFNPTTTISYTIAEPAFVSLSVYSLLGKKVLELVNESKSQGSYNIQLDAANLSSGVYYYQLVVDDFIQTKKLTIIK